MATAHTIQYSFVIPVYNRLEEMREFLESIAALEFPKDQWELIVVDDGSTDGFFDFFEAWALNSEVNSSALKQENKGPGAARNLGTKAAKGNYILYIDSDCTFPKNYLSEVHASLEKNRWDAFGGPDTCRPDFSPLLKAINYSMTSFIGTGGTRGGKKAVTKFYPRSFNMGISQEVFATVGEMGGLRHGQDMDYSAKIYKANFSVGLISQAVVYHKRRTSLPRFFRQIFNWGVARINLSLLHENMLKPVHLLPALILLGYGLLLIGSAISVLLSGLLYLSVLSHLALCLYVFVESSLRNRSVKVGVLSILTINYQVFAYGAGLIWALWQTRVLGRKEARGYTKNYYGKSKSTS